MSTQKKKLPLDVERLARLQEQQMSALTGGEDGCQSNCIDVTVEIPELISNRETGAKSGADRDPVDGESCCRKSC